MTKNQNIIKLVLVFYFSTELCFIVIKLFDGLPTEILNRQKFQRQQLGSNV